MECIDRLRKGVQKKAEKGKVSVVDRDRFQELHPDGRRLIEGWAKRASDNRTCSPENSFEPFIFGWIAFNGWASCVTGEDQERDYLDALVLDAGLDREFSEMLLGADFMDAVRDFQNFWPIFRSSKIGYTVDEKGTRQQVIERYRKVNPPLDHTPACAFFHADDGGEIPLDWAHTLLAIYQVRCNLFHGYKGLHPENDVLIVSSAFRVLVRLPPMLALSGKAESAPPQNECCPKPY